MPVRTVVFNPHLSSTTSSVTWLSVLPSYFFSPGNHRLNSCLWVLNGFGGSGTFHFHMHFLFPSKCSKIKMYKAWDWTLCIYYATSTFNLACACSVLRLVVEHILNIMKFWCSTVLFSVSINGRACMTMFILSLEYPVSSWLLHNYFLSTLIDQCFAFKL